MGERSVLDLLMHGDFFLPASLSVDGGGGHGWAGLCKEAGSECTGHAILGPSRNNRRGNLSVSCLGRAHTTVHEKRTTMGNTIPRGKATPPAVAQSEKPDWICYAWVRKQDVVALAFFGIIDTAIVSVLRSCGRVCVPPGGKKTGGQRFGEIPGEKSLTDNGTRREQ